MISLLDQDFYTYTVGQTIFQSGMSHDVVYKFYDRQQRIKYKDVIETLHEYVEHISTLRYTPDELEYLRQWLSPNYVQWLSNFRYNPKQIKFYNQNGLLGIKMKGKWNEAIFWEVPILAAVSEIFYKTQDSFFRTFSEETWLSADKLNKLKAVDINQPFIEGGTRRRRSFNVQDAVLYGLQSKCHTNKMIGTSNVYFAKKYDFKPVGTMSHQWPMAHVALYGLDKGMKKAKRIWQVLNEDNPGFFLTDTYTTEDFLSRLTAYEARHFDGFRQDSGDPIKIAHMICDKYRELGISPHRKQLVFSDSLTIDKVRHICNYIRDNSRDYLQRSKLDIDPIFMIGTHFTNDYEDQALNIVIKLHKIKLAKYYDWKYCVKLSDDYGKHTGNKKTCSTLLRQIDKTVKV